MSKRPPSHLPVLPRGHGGEAKPTLELMRRRLGGPRETFPAAREGSLGTYRGDAVLVLHEEAATGRVDLWLGDGRALRAPGSELSTEDGVEPSAALARTADDLRLFLSLATDQRVRFLSGDGVIREGKLIERCRFGGLVALDDGVVLGVGFSRFLPPPAPSRGASPS